MAVGLPPFRLEPGADAFEQITADDVAQKSMFYVARDHATVFGYGNGDNASGLARGGL